MSRSAEQRLRALIVSLAAAGGEDREDILRRLRPDHQARARALLDAYMSRDWGERSGGEAERAEEETASGSFDKLDLRLVVDGVGSSFAARIEEAQSSPRAWHESDRAGRENESRPSAKALATLLEVAGQAPTARWAAPQLEAVEAPRQDVRRRWRWGLR